MSIRVSLHLSHLENNLSFLLKIKRDLHLGHRLEKERCFLFINPLTNQEAVSESTTNQHRSSPELTKENHISSVIPCGLSKTKNYLVNKIVTRLSKCRTCNRIFPKTVFLTLKVLNHVIL